MNYQNNINQNTDFSKNTSLKSNFIEDKTLEIPLVISEKVQDKIIYLTRRFFDVEWSGILFYSLKGKIEDGTLELLAEDILTMDIGSVAHTSFKIDNRFIEYMEENPEALDWKFGLVHSHNNMRVFFSGEDLSELEDNTPNHNFYLSLIVNNRLEMIAYLATQVEFSTTLKNKSVKALNADGVPYEAFKKDFIVSYKKILLRNCKITQAKNKYCFEDTFEEKINYLEQTIKKEATKKINAFDSSDSFKEYAPNKGVINNKKEIPTMNGNLSIISSFIDSICKEDLKGNETLQELRNIFKKNFKSLKGEEIGQCLDCISLFLFNNAKDLQSLIEIKRALIMFFESLAKDYKGATSTIIKYINTF